MEIIKQSLKSNDIDISEVEDIAKIYTMLGNQQEAKKIYAVLNNYLKDIKSGFSIWEFSNAGKVEMVWYKDDKEKKKEFKKKHTVINTYKRNKNPIFEMDKTGMYAMIPIVSREMVKGFLCIHDEVEMDARWKRIYVAVTMLPFVFKYYEMIKESNELSVNDLMTGLYNARHFSLQIGIEVDKADRFKKPLSIVVAKIKDFDIITEKLGFEGGEIALREFAKIFSESGRKTDMPSRLNDEVFATLLYETDDAGAKIYVDRLKNLMAKVPIEVGDAVFHLELDCNYIEYELGMSPEQFLSKAREI